MAKLVGKLRSRSRRPRGSRRGDRESSAAGAKTLATSTGTAPGSSARRTSRDEMIASSRFRAYRWFEELAEPAPVREIVKAFGPHVLKFKWSLLRAFTAFFVAATLAMVFPMTSKYIIDYLLPSGNYSLVVVTAAALFILHVLHSVIHTLGSWVLTYTSMLIVFDLRERIFEHLQLLHLAFYEREYSGKLVSKLMGDASALQSLISSALPTLSVNVFSLIVTIILMTLLSPRLTLIALTVIPAYMLISWYFKNLIYVRSRQLRERHSIVHGNLTEMISGIKLVKSFGMEQEESQRIVGMIRETLDYEIDLNTTNSLRNTLLGMVAMTSRIMIVLVGVGAVMGNTLTLGDYVAFGALLGMMFSPLQAISGLTIQSVTARTGLERVLNILRIEPAVVERANARLATKLDGHVKFESVTFGYTPERPVLHDFSLDVTPGQSVALVGPSGSGKSTIANLLTRFYDPTRGRIAIDGLDLRNYNLKSYRQRVGIVLQEPFLFSGTIFDNICYGKGLVTYREVEEAARRANALEFINDMPDGMETQVGERGASLSGGQRQRVSIARALLKDPDILILDEATSALDTTSERLIQQALERLMQGRTVFLIAHRLTTIQDADLIVVLRDGRLVEKGSHDELIAQGGLYASLFSRNIPEASVEDLFVYPSSDGDGDK